MTSDERKKRSDPSRGGSRRTVIEHDHPGDNPQPEGAPPPPPEPPGIREVIGDAVKLGYNVVEEYLEQGRQAAGRFRAGSYTSADIESDVAALAERLMRTTKDAAVAWLDVVSAAARVASPRPPGGGGGGPISVEVHTEA